MKTKNLIFLTLVVGVIIIGVVLTIFLLASQPVKNTSDITTPTSSPVSHPEDNIITIDQGNTDGFFVASITKEDTIELRDSQNQIVPINLDHRNWKDINWSPDGKLIAVLGNTAPGIDDLFIFNLQEKSWRTATTFNQSGHGIDSYAWKDSNIILFTQGVSPDHWLHRYVYSSREIIKIAKVDGIVYSVAPDGKSFLLETSRPESTKKFTFYALDGSVLYSLDRVQDTTGNKNISIAKIMYTPDPNTIIITAVTGKVYQHTFGNSSAIEIPEAVNTVPICGVNENVILVTKQDSAGNLYVETLNFKNPLTTQLAKMQFSLDSSINYDLSKCFNVNNISLNITKDSTATWCTIDNGKIVEFVILDNSKETSFRDLNVK